MREPDDEEAEDGWHLTRLKRTEVADQAEGAPRGALFCRRHDRARSRLLDYRTSVLDVALHLRDEVVDSIERELVAQPPPELDPQGLAVEV